MKENLRLEGIGTKHTNYYGYTVCSDGTVLNKNGSIKKFRANDKGYLVSNFYYEGRLNCHLVHTFIWRAFNGTIPTGYEVDHVNNSRSDNRLTNLQLLTKSQNNKKAYDSGNRNFIFGDTNPNSLKRKSYGTS